MADDQNLAPEGDEAEVSVPEWVPEKFRTNPEKFGEAYANLEREFHATKQQAKGMEQTLQELSSQLEDLQVAQQQPQYDQQTVQDQLLERYESDPIGTMAHLASQIADQRLQKYQQDQQNQFAPTAQAAQEMVAYQANQILSGQHQDWDEYAPKVGEYLEQNPWMIPQDALSSPQQTARILEGVYKQVKFDDLASDPAAQTAAAAQLMKENAQTMSGAAGRPATPDALKEEWEAVQRAAKTAPGRYW